MATRASIKLSQLSQPTVSAPDLDPSPMTDQLRQQDVIDRQKQEQELTARLNQQAMDAGMKTGAVPGMAKKYLSDKKYAMQVDAAGNPFGGKPLLS